MIIPSNRLEERQININMRCIEIYDSATEELNRNMININMRCIEINIGKGVWLVPM